jgi:hypothetical protein
MRQMHFIAKNGEKDYAKNIIKYNNENTTKNNINNTDKES